MSNGNLFEYPKVFKRRGDPLRGTGVEAPVLALAMQVASSLEACLRGEGSLQAQKAAEAIELLRPTGRLGAYLLVRAREFDAEELVHPDEFPRITWILRIRVVLEELRVGCQALDAELAAAKGAVLALPADTFYATTGGVARKGTWWSSRYDLDVDLPEEDIVEALQWRECATGCPICGDTHEGEGWECPGCGTI
jgi:hypothetical protein